MARLERYEQALPRVIAGHGHYRRLEWREAAREYMAAAALSPEDLGLTRNLLMFPGIQKRVEALKDDPFSLMMLGEAFMVQPDKRELAGQALRSAGQVLARRLAAEPAESTDEAATGRARRDAAALEQVRRWLGDLDGRQSASE